MHCDKHVVKMIIEYAQLMSTAHRVLDGEEYFDKTANGRKIQTLAYERPRMGNWFDESLPYQSSVWYMDTVE
jgi:hypothetical protein